MKKVQNREYLLLIVRGLGNNIYKLSEKSDVIEVREQVQFYVNKSTIKSLILQILVNNFSKKCVECETGL